MTHETGRDFDPRKRENPWWQTGNMSQIFNTTLKWDGDGEQSASSSGFYLLANALGFGRYSSEGALRDDLRAQGRTPLESVVRLKGGVYGTLFECKKGQDSELGSFEIHTRDDGFWLPKVTSSTLDGQYFSVVGEDIAAEEINPYNRIFPLVRGSFSPDGAISTHYPGGEARFLYLWDRQKGEMTLEKVDSIELGVRANDWNNNSANWADAGGQDTDVLIKPFGTFTLAGGMTQQDWLKNLLFPKAYSWREDSLNPREFIYGEPAFGFNIFDIKFKNSYINTIFE